MKLKHLLLLVLLSLSSVFATAQQHIVFNHLTIYDGLSQATVNSIIQDKDNVMWFGTRDGLNRYDGYNFKVYKYSLRDAHSISNNKVKVVFEDKVGDLWIGTDRGLNRFNKKTETFERYIAEEDNFNSISDNNIRDIAEDAAGNLWIATGRGGVCRISFDENKPNRQVNKIERYKSSDDIHSLSGNSVRCLFLDKTGNFWIGTDKGLSLLVSKNNKFSFERIVDDNIDFSSISVNTITDDNLGNLWIGTWGKGLIQMSNAQSKPIFKQYLPSNSYDFKEPYIISLFTDDSGNIWVGTWTSGLSILKQRNGQTTFSHYQHEPLSPRSLSHNSVRSIYQDKTGVVWIGTYGNGISKYDKYASKFQHFDQDAHQPNGLKSEDIYAISEDNFGYVWVGSWIGGLHRTRQLSTGVYQHFSTKAFPNFTEEKITNLFLDSKKRLWVGTWGKGVYQVQFKADGTVTGFKSTAILNEKGEIARGFQNIRQVYEDRSGTIWLATNKGVYRLKNNQFEYIQLFRDKQFSKSLGDEDIVTMMEDSRGNLWIGSAWQGLAYISIKAIKSGQQHIVTSFRHSPNNLLSISSDNISAIYEDKEKNLWIGTAGTGINLFDYKKKTFKSFTESDGLPNGVINSILEDERGNLWLSTNKGISKFDTQNRIFENYDVRDGLQSNEFIKASAYKNAKGYMYFGGINGINYFHPSKIKSNEIVPELIFTDFKVFNKSVDFKKSNAVLSKPIHYTKEINLSYKDKIFSFEFAALNYTNPERNQYQYRLVGFNNIWQNIGTQRSVTFTNLNPGSYVLKVKGTNNDGYWNETPISIKINILPPFWATWWFRSLVAFVIVLAVFAFFRYRTRQVRIKNEQLEKLVRERTNKIEKQKALIEERSKFKEQFFSNVSHELRSPLNGILGISHLLAKTELNKTQRQFTDAIKRSADNLLVIINDLLDISKINAGQLELVQKPFDTIALFTTLYELFRPRAKEKGLKLQFDISHDIPQYLSGDQVRFYQILINLLGNALKFTAQGHIKLKIDIKKKDDEHNLWLKIKVDDTGIGIPAEKVNNIFYNYTQVIDSSGYHYEGSGLGLSIVKNLVELKGGNIKVLSEQNKGTTFTLLLPFVLPTDEAIDSFLEEEANLIFKQKWEGKKILLVEDNEVSSMYAQNLFIEWQLNAHIATTTAEAEKLTAIHDYDCILMDIRLPDGNGWQIIRDIRENTIHKNHKTPVIVLTANTAAQEKSRAVGLDVFLYMTKPFDPDSLMRALNLVFTECKDHKANQYDVDYHYLSDVLKMSVKNKQKTIALIETYLQEVPEFQANIGKHIEAKDYENLYFETLSMITSLKKIGVAELIEIMQAINQAVRQLNSFQTIGEMYSDFERKHNIHLIKLKEEVKKLKNKAHNIEY